MSDLDTLLPRWQGRKPEGAFELNLADLIGYAHSKNKYPLVRGYLVTTLVVERVMCDIRMASDRHREQFGAELRDLLLQREHGLFSNGVTAFWFPAKEMERFCKAFERTGIDVSLGQSLPHYV